MAEIAHGLSWYWSQKIATYKGFTVTKYWVKYCFFVFDSDNFYSILRKDIK